MAERASNIATYAGSATMIIGGLSLNDWAIVIGAVIGVASFFANIYFKYKMLEVVRSKGVKMGDDYGILMSNVKKFIATTLAGSVLGISTIVMFETSGKVITEAYLDPANIPTICVGHIKGVTLGMKVTPEQCQTWLKEDLSYEGKAIGRYVKVPISQGQYDALLSFTFNVGAGNLSSFTLLKYLNSGQCEKAANEFLKWNKARVKGKLVPLAGLTKRRQYEHDLFIKDC